MHSSGFCITLPNKKSLDIPNVSHLICASCKSCQDRLLSDRSVFVLCILFPLSVALFSGKYGFSHKPRRSLPNIIIHNLCPDTTCKRGNAHPLPSLSAFPPPSSCFFIKERTAFYTGHIHKSLFIIMREQQFHIQISEQVLHPVRINV